MKLTLGQLLLLISGVIAILQKEGVLLPDGTFASPLDVEAVAKAGVDVEQLLKAHGLEVVGKLDSLIQLAPVIAVALK